MLKEYKKKYTKAVFQYSIIDFKGKVLESDNTLFPDFENKLLEDIHPFFYSIDSLLVPEEKETVFSCIHLNIGTKVITADVILQTFKN